MSAHLSNEIVERFHAQELTPQDRGAIYGHVLDCETCRQRVVTVETEGVAVRTLTEYLLPIEGEEPFHLDGDTIEAFVDDNLDPTDRSMVNLHLEDCAECLREVNDLRESLATMRAASRQPGVASPNLKQEAETGFRIPMRIAAAVALVAFLSIALLVIWKLRSAPSSGNGVTAGSQPTPAASPQTNPPGPSPSANNSPEQPKLAANPPPKATNERGTETAVLLKDGPNQIGVAPRGSVTGLETLPSESREAARQVLMGEEVSRPDILHELTTADASVRGPTNGGDRIRIIYPASVVISTDNPTLRWAPSKAAISYRVEILDEGFHQVAKSEDLPSTRQTWTPSAPLTRGGVYTWTIRAVNKEGDASPVTSQSKFKILDAQSVKELNRMKTSRSHLALGLFYARQGMVAEAEREFRILAKDNPNSNLPNRLLANIRSWRRR